MGQWLARQTKQTDSEEFRSAAMDIRFWITDRESKNFRKKLTSPAMKMHLYTFGLPDTTLGENATFLSFSAIRLD